MADLLKDIEVLNDTVRELNKNRDEALWRKSSIEEELQTEIKAYADKYGVVLTKDNIEIEFARVESELRKQYEDLKSKVEMVQRGESIETLKEGVTIEASEPVPVAQPRPTTEKKSGFMSDFESPASQDTELSLEDRLLGSSSSTPTKPQSSNPFEFDFSKYVK